MASRLKNVSKSNVKNSLQNDNITVDAKHNEMINYFKNLQDSVPSLKEELKKLISEYNTKDPSRKNDIEYIMYKDNLKEKINSLKEKINGILNNDEMNNYYLNVGLLLNNYYENIETSKNINSNSENFEENLLNYDEITSDDDEFDYETPDKREEPKKDNNYKSVLNFFNSRETKEPDTENNDNNINANTITNNTTPNDNVYTSMKISDFVEEKSTFKKKDILDEYLQKIDSNYVVRIKVDVNICKCKRCNLEMTVYPSDGIQICENCGLQENILIESDKPSFKDPPMEVCYFSYKRINHYNEFAIDDKFYINESYKNILCI